VVVELAVAGFGAEDLEAVDFEEAGLEVVLEVSVREDLDLVEPLLEELGLVE